MSPSDLKAQRPLSGVTTEEEQRLAAVAALELLDTEPEERFDRLARLAQDLLQVPTAYVSLIAENRQWYKARCGLDLTETERSDALCDYTIRFPQPTIALNTLEHPVFHDNRYVVGDPKVRFYLGFPLTVKGHRVGTLCTIDFEPRTEVTDRQMAQLDALARIAETELLLKDTLETQELLLKHRNELKEKNEFVRRVLGRYVTDEVAEHVLSAPEELHLGGERREVTILMSDLRGFTVMSDRLTPETVVSVLNHYLHHMVEIALKWGGTIDEIIGDALLIIFGAPLPLEDHAVRAASCAIDMQRAMPKVNACLAAEGLPPIACGIGMNTGEVVVGNIGSEKRMKYSCVGSPVNLTARVESLTIGGQILASEATTLALGERARVDGKLRVNMKGFDKPVTIYEIGGIDDLLVPEHG